MQSASGPHFEKINHSMRLDSGYPLKGVLALNQNGLNVISGYSLMFGAGVQHRRRAQGLEADMEKLHVAAAWCSFPFYCAGSSLQQRSQIARGARTGLQRGVVLQIRAMQRNEAGWRLQVPSESIHRRNVAQPKRSGCVFC